MTVTKQQQLEWMANKVDAWDDDRTIGYMMSRDEVGFVVGLFTRMSSIEMLTGNFHIITREEWQRERDRIAEMNAMTMQMCKIKPLGRDKMQKQDDESECAVMTLSEAIDHANEKSRELNGSCATNHSLLARWLTAYRDILSGYNKPEPDNSWHERVELPPLGSIVSVENDYDTHHISDESADCIGAECVVMAAFHRDNGKDKVGIVCVMEPKGGCYCFRLSMIRPIRTGREKAIDAACDVICKNGVHDFERGVITKLYDAGMLK